MTYPKIAIIIPTFNSSKTLTKTLSSIRKQLYDPDSIKIYVIDGGSSDKTIEIAKRNNCNVLDNPKTQQEYAKHIGLLKAKEDIAIYLDSDEEFENSDAVSKRVQILMENPHIKFIVSGGYRRPADAPEINDYINYYSDPFAFFMYGMSSEASLYAYSWAKKYKYKEYPNFFAFTFRHNDILPLVDICAGNTIDLHYLRSTFSKEINDEHIIPVLFYKMTEKNKTVAMVKDDAIIHHSAENLTKFLNKIKWRIIVNIHYRDIPGTGFSNREYTQPLVFKLKKYLFIPYALTLIGPFITSLLFFIRYRKKILLLHGPLSFYTGILIIYYYVLLILGIKPKLKTYGDDRTLLFTK